MRPCFAPFHSAKLRPYLPMVSSFVANFTTAKHRILRNVLQNRQQFIIKKMSEIFEIKESGSFGRGLFATQLMKNGERILEFTGPIISLEEALQKTPDKLSCPLQIGPTKYIDIQEPGVLANHSCSPNAGVQNDRFLVAIQDIQPGQEIFYDYSTTMDEDNWTLECKCGNPNCRHTISDFRHLPPEVQKSYLQLNIVQSFIREKLLASIA